MTKSRHLFRNFSDQSFCSVLTSSVLGNDVVVVVVVVVVFVVVVVGIVVVAVVFVVVVDYIAVVVIAVIVAVVVAVEATLFLPSSRSSSQVLNVEDSQLPRGSIGLHQMQMAPLVLHERPSQKHILP